MQEIFCLPVIDTCHLKKSYRRQKNVVCTESVYLCREMPGVLQQIWPATEIVPLNLIRIIPAKGGFGLNAVTGPPCLALRANL